MSKKLLLIFLLLISTKTYAAPETAIISPHLGAGYNSYGGAEANIGLRAYLLGSSELDPLKLSSGHATSFLVLTPRVELGTNHNGYSLGLMGMYMNNGGFFKPSYFMGPLGVRYTKYEDSVQSYMIGFDALGFAVYVGTQNGTSTKDNENKQGYVASVELNLW